MEFPSNIGAPKLESSNPDVVESNYDLCPLPDLLSLETPSFHVPPPTPFSIPIVSRPMKLPSNEIARKRRKKISDRIKALESLMPWEKKMDMGTMLEEARKYIKFLESQVTALQTMPAWSSRSERIGPARSELEMLNRQQMLMVMVNSSAVQDLMTKKGLCVFSAEQAAELAKSPLTTTTMLESTSSASR